MIPKTFLNPGLSIVNVLAAVLASSVPSTPALAAAPEPYVNTQFVEARAGQKVGRLVIRNNSILPRKVFARIEIPDDPDNRNNGFVQTVPPLSAIAYELPLGARVYACDGKYWDDYRPADAFAVTIASADTFTFTTSQFKPSALRRAKGE